MFQLLFKYEFVGVGGWGVVVSLSSLEGGDRPLSSGLSPDSIIESGFLKKYKHIQNRLTHT